MPPDLQITFNDFDGVAVNLTGYTAQMNIQEELGELVGTGVINITTPASGIAIYTWVRADMEVPGRYSAQAWVFNGTKYFASDLYMYDVYDGPGEPPV